MMTGTFAPWVVALALATSPGSADDFQKLGFLAGAWRGEQGKARFEEHWLPAEGDMMLGLSRTLVGGKTVAFEFLRIEKRSDGIFYVAQPNGRPPTEFALTGIADDSATFENPAHDHPKIIRYRRAPGGSLSAEIEGDEKGRRVKQEFLFQPLHRPPL